jgi:hypothetical protein
LRHAALNAKIILNLPKLYRGGNENTGNILDD